MPKFKPSDGFKMNSPFPMKSPLQHPHKNKAGHDKNAHNTDTGVSIAQGGKGNSDNPNLTKKSPAPAKRVKTPNEMAGDAKKNRGTGKGSGGYMTSEEGKRTFKEAYKKRDMKTYGNLSQEEYTKEAKRQTANKKATTVSPKEVGVGGKKSKGKEGSYDAPKSQMKGSVTGPKTKGGDATKKSTPKITQETKLPVTKDSKKTQSVKDAKSKRKEARKAVKTARKTSGRGSDEVKAAKKARKTAKANVKTAKKNRKSTKKQSKEFAKN